MAKIIKIIGLKEFETAIKQNPAVVIKEARLYFTRALAEYKRVVGRAPWRVGGSGGGVPVAEGNLFNAHGTKFKKYSASYGIVNNIKYAGYVHGGTSRMEERPWLDYAIIKQKSNVKKLYTKMLSDIVKQLAK